MQVVRGRSLVLHLIDITVRPYVRPFIFNVPFRFTRLLKLHSLVFDLTLFGLFVLFCVRLWEYRFLISPPPTFTDIQIGRKTKIFADQRIVIRFTVI